MLKNERELEILAALRSAGYEVYVPQEHDIPGAWEMPNEEWAKKVFVNDVDAIHSCDVVMVLNFGMYSDSGTAWEAGYAAALEIPVIQVLCGFENCTYSLMMMNGCDKIIHAENVAFWESECACVGRDKIIQK